MLSDSVSLADISSADTAENTVSAKSNFSLDRLDLMTKPWWTRLAISLGFVLAALGLTSLLWLVVDRPIRAALFLASIVGSAWLCGFRAGIFATVVSGIVIDYCFVPPYYQFSA